MALEEIFGIEDFAERIGVGGGFHGYAPEHLVGVAETVDGQAHGLLGSARYPVGGPQRRHPFGYEIGAGAFQVPVVIYGHYGGHLVGEGLSEVARQGVGEHVAVGAVGDAYHLFLPRAGHEVGEGDCGRNGNQHRHAGEDDPQQAATAFLLMFLLRHIVFGGQFAAAGAWNGLGHCQDFGLKLLIMRAISRASSGRVPAIGRLNTSLASRSERGSERWSSTPR